MTHLGTNGSEHNFDEFLLPRGQTR